MNTSSGVSQWQRPADFPAPHAAAPSPSCDSSAAPPPAPSAGGGPASAATTGGGGGSAAAVLITQANPVVKANPTPKESDKEWEARIHADYSDYGCVAIMGRGCSCKQCHPYPGGRLLTALAAALASAVQTVIVIVKIVTTATR